MRPEADERESQIFSMCLAALKCKGKKSSLTKDGKKFSQDVFTRKF